MNGNQLTRGILYQRSSASTRDEASGLYRIDRTPLRKTIAQGETASSVTKNQRRACLVLIEEGARARSFAAAATDYGTAAIQSQDPNEAPVDWARRVLREISEVEQAGIRLRKAALLVANRFDDASMTARHVIGRALLAHARRCPGETFEFFFSVPREQEGPLRDGILTLVELLVSKPEASGATFHVHFHDAERSAVE